MKKSKSEDVAEIFSFSLNVPDSDCIQNSIWDEIINTFENIFPDFVHGKEDESSFRLEKIPLCDYREWLDEFVILYDKIESAPGKMNRAFHENFNKEKCNLHWHLEISTSIYKYMKFNVNINFRKLPEESEIVDPKAESKSTASDNDATYIVCYENISQELKLELCPEFLLSRLRKNTFVDIYRFYSTKNKFFIG